MVSKFVKLSTNDLVSLSDFIDSSLMVRLRWVSFFNVALIIVFYLYKKLIFGVISSFLNSCKCFFNKVDHRVLLVFLPFFLIKVCLAIVTPLTTDELFNFNNYIQRGPLVALSFGVGPNNHVLHTFISSLVYWLSGLPKFSIRFTELLTLLLFFLFFLKKNIVRLGWLKSFLLLIILNLSIDFFWQSSISRGYLMLFVFSYFYIYYGFKWLTTNQRRHLLYSGVFGIMGTCVLPVFVLVLFTFFLFVLFNQQANKILFAKQILAMMVVSFLFYEPMIIFSGKNFILGNGWVHQNLHFKDQFTFLFTELLSLSGFGSWALGLAILALKIVYVKKEPVALLSILLWGVILGFSIIFQYAAPVRVYGFLLTVNFFFLIEIAKTLELKSIVFASVLMVLIFINNIRIQVVPVYKRYEQMEEIMNTEFTGEIFTNSDLYYNKALYLFNTENYPPVTYATDRISKHKYLILTHKNSFSQSDLNEYEQIGSNQEVYIYRRK